MKAEPFTIQIDQAAIDQIITRVRDYQWHEMPEIAAGGDRWAYGADMRYLQELCAYWQSDYDWRRVEARLNSFDNYIAEIDGMQVHFIYEQGSGSNPKPVLMTHGWPGSVLEFIDIIRPLAHPEEFGGDPEDGLTIICPSLPGYGFSGKPKTPIGPQETAALWDRLMREVLDIPSYIAQGGDWGSVVTGCLGLSHSAHQGGGCEAIHLNMYGLRVADAKPETQEEIDWITDAQLLMAAEGGYLHVQSTKPQSLSYAMMDSPVGTCAWIVEKFYGWSVLPEAGNIESRYSKDQLLDNVMVYLLTRSFNTSIWFYYAYVHNPPAIPTGEKVTVPTGIAAYHDPFLKFPPRRMVEVGYHVTHWQDYPEWGHFAAMESGEVFVNEIRDFVKSLS